MKMKRTIFLFAVFLATTLQAQDLPETSSQLSVNFMVPSLEWEKKTGTTSTLVLNLGTAFVYRKSTYSSGYAVFPTLQAQYRKYYNFNKRLEKGKKISENSGNYITALVDITSGNPILGDLESMADYSVFLGPAWGLQRIYHSGFKLNLNLGIGYGFNDLGDSYFAPMVGLQLGWLLSK